MSGHRKCLATVALLLLATSPEVSGQTNPPSAPDLAAREKASCVQNLETIYRAIQAFQTEKKALPNWLSDLVPAYLPDANVLLCPVCKRTGKTEETHLADPRLPSSYLFEFCPVPLGNQVPHASKRTRRDWKRRQMGLVGSKVPIVRCRNHSPVLNVAFDGEIYESPPNWESAVTNILNPEDLSMERLFPADPPKTDPRFPVRSPQAGPGQLDLQKFFNAALSEPWLGPTNGTLAGAPAGLQTIDGVRFDLRGVVQLAGKMAVGKNFPTQVKGIPVGRRCRQLHFLHAAAFAFPSDDGTQVASYFVRFKGNPARVEIPIQCGRDLRNWQAGQGEPGGGEAKQVWTQPAPGSGKPPPARFFKTDWVNFAPDAEIESIDLVSSNAGPAPFLLAITAE